MTYWLLILILAGGKTQVQYAYGSRDLCDAQAHGYPHICKRVTYEVDR